MFASLSYFTLRYLRDLRTESMGARLPYGADPETRSLFYTVHANPSELFAYPFLYQAQFMDVQEVVAVPFERLVEIDQPARSTVHFVFSIGRCGSTLLAKIRGAAGLTAISEPDIFTQMARREVRQFSVAERRDCIAASTRCLAGYGSDKTVIKLRNHCNSIAQLIAGASDGARCEFVLRNRRDWARSMIAAFSTDTKVLARQLRTAVESLDRLVESGYCTGPLWYEDIVRHPANVLQRFSEKLPPGLEGHLAGAVGRDSQTETRLSQRSLSRRIVSDDLLNRFEEEWQEARPQSLLRKHNLLDRL